MFLLCWKNISFLLIFSSFLDLGTHMYMLINWKVSLFLVHNFFNMIITEKTKYRSNSIVVSVYDLIIIIFFITWQQLRYGTLLLRKCSWSLSKKFLILVLNKANRITSHQIVQLDLFYYCYLYYITAWIVFNT